MILVHSFAFTNLVKLHCICAVELGLKEANARSSLLTQKWPFLVDEGSPQLVYQYPVKDNSKLALVSK